MKTISKIDLDDYAVKLIIVPTHLQDQLSTVCLASYASRMVCLGILEANKLRVKYDKATFILCLKGKI